MELYTGVNVPGLPSGLSVAVYDEGTSDLSAIFDKAGSAITQPGFQVAAGGRFEFQAENGRYDIKLGGGAGSPDTSWNGGAALWLYRVTLIDPATIQGGGNPNAVINGCCRIAQRSAPNISGSYQYGQVDRIAAKADGTPTAGTVAQAETALLGSTGFASHLSGVTVGAGGAVYWRYRIESRDVQRFIDQAAIFSCLAYHDVGSAVDYTVIVNKANTQDDFSAVTQIAVSGAATSVPSATETGIELAVADMGACGNGVEIIVKADCGAVITKNFYLAELQLVEGGTAAGFERRPMAEELILCRRYFEKSYDQGVAPGSSSPLGARSAYGQGSTTLIGGGVFQMEKRVAPSVSIYSPGGTAGKVWTAATDADTGSGVAANNVGTTGFRYLSSGALDAGPMYTFHFTADSEL